MTTASRRRRIGPIVLALASIAACAVMPDAAARELATDHFVLYYEGGFGTSSEYIRWVGEGLEAAYKLFASYGFTVFSPPIPVDIYAMPDGELGAAYLEADEHGDWRPVIEIGDERTLSDYLVYAYVDTSLEDLVKSTCAHELFHVVQEHQSLQGTGDISEWAFVESHATAIQEIAVPTANDYLEPALDFLVAPDSVAFSQRAYDAGIFWVYVIERFGLEMLHDVIEASADYDGRHAIEHAIEPRGLAFLDLWTDFAVAVAVGDIPDADLLGDLVELEQERGWWTRTRATAPLPTVTFRGTWNGEPLDVTHVNAGNESDYLPTYDEDPSGTPLRVAHAYGVDYIDIDVAEPIDVRIEFEGNPDTEFRVAFAVEADGAWTWNALVSPGTVPLDERTKRIRFVITRSEAGTGTYKISLRPA